MQRFRSTTATCVNPAQDIGVDLEACNHKTGEQNSDDDAEINENPNDIKTEMLAFIVATMLTVSFTVLYLYRSGVFL